MRGIPHNIVDHHWQRIKKAILDHDKKSGFLKWYPLDFIYASLLKSDWQCWETDHSIFLTCITVYPSGYKEFEILLVVGEGMEQWNNMAWHMLKAYAYNMGCDEIKWQGRKGWERYGKQHEPDLKTEYRYRVTL